MYNIGSLSGLHGLDFDSIEETILNSEESCKDLLDEVESTVAGTNNIKSSEERSIQEDEIPQHESLDSYREEYTQEHQEGYQEDSQEYYEGSQEYYEGSGEFESEDTDLTEEDLTEEDFEDDFEDDFEEEELEDELDSDLEDELEAELEEDLEDTEELSDLEDDMLDEEDLDIDDGDLDDDIDTDEMLSEYEDDEIEEQEEYEPELSDDYEESKMGSLSDRSVRETEHTNKEEIVQKIDSEKTIAVQPVEVKEVAIEIKKDNRVSDLDELKARLERLELEKRIRDLEEDLGKSKGGKDEKVTENNSVRDKNDDEVDAGNIPSSDNNISNCSSTVSNKEGLKNKEQIHQELDKEEVKKEVVKRRRVVQKPEEKTIDYSKLDISALFNIVQSYMLSRNIGKQLISRKEIEEKFGRDNVKKLIKKGYIIAIGEKVTIS